MHSDIVLSHFRSLCTALTVGPSSILRLRHPRLLLKMQCKSFINSGNFYSVSSTPLLLRSAPDTARIGLLCRSFTPKRHRQLRVKDLPTVPTWRLERDLNPRPFERKATDQPMSHHAVQNRRIYIT